MAMLGAGSAALSCAAPAAADALHYTIVDLGSPGTSTSLGRAINNGGVVAGTFYTDAGTTPFYAAPGQPSVAFGAATSDYDFTESTGIDDSGQVVGTSATVDGRNGFRFTPGGGMTMIAPLPNDDGTEAAGINAAGVVVGTSTQARGPRGNISAIHAFTDTPGGGGPVDIGSIDGGWTFGYAINNRGQVTGQSVIENGSEHGADHAFVYTPGIGIVDIDPFGSTSHGRAINDAGQVAGYAFTPDRDYRRAFLYTPGVGTRMLNEAGDTSAYSAWGINQSGTVVGSIEGDGYDGFVFDGRQTLTLDRLVLNLGTDTHVLAAYAINDLGQITGDALFGDEVHAFRLDPAGIAPIPEPSAWLLLTAGFGMIGATMRRRGRAVA